MVIWILNHYAQTPNLPGSTRHYDFGRELIKRGYKVVIFASDFNYLLLKKIKNLGRKNWEAEDIKGLKFIWLKTFPHQKNDWRRVINLISFGWRSYWIGRKIIQDNIEKPDIIIGSSVHLLAPLSAFLLSKYYKAKFIMEVRDLWPQTLIDTGKFRENNLVIKFLKFLEKFLYIKAEKIITLLPLTAKYIISLGISQDKIIWIPNGLDLSPYEKEEIKKNTIKDFIAMYLGAHGPFNSLKTVLEAAKIIQDKNYLDIKFIFVGGGVEKKNLIDYKEKIGLFNTEFRHPVAKERVPFILSEADVLIFSLKRAAVFQYGISPNKLLDYMASKKPIIFSADAQDNIIEKIGCGINTPPENPKQLAEAIIKIYQLDNEERRLMGERGYEFVKKNYDIKILIRKFEDLLSNF